MHTGKHKSVKCDKTFARNHHLANHMMTHTGEKPNRCTKCEKTFAQNAHLKAHIWIHSQKKTLNVMNVAK